MATDSKNNVSTSVVLYSGPYHGHVVAILELAKLFLTHGFRVIVVVVEPLSDAGSTASLIARVSTSHPSITFHILTPVVLPETDYVQHESLNLELIRLANPQLRSCLSSIRPSPAAIILDFFCFYAIDVASELRIPFYFSCSSSATSVASLLHIYAQHHEITESFADLGSIPIHIPGVPPIPANHMPLPILYRHSDSYSRFLELSRRMTEATGIIVNTYEWLEPHALKAIRDGLCVADDNRPTPPIYCIGPMVVATPTDPMDRCLRWLDSQPGASVVFLCFGSMGRFSAEQLKEIATGLEASGQRFLWVVRSPPNDERSSSMGLDLEELLPRGFLDRTSERGLVVGPWAPQLAVLGHVAVGGFVSHLGWNSILEAVLEGVPMVGWPLYAEQRVNKVFAVDRAGLAAAIDGYDEATVMAEEVERKVRQLMEGEEGRRLRERMAEAKEKAREALAVGGTSARAVEELMTILKTRGSTQCCESHG